MIIMFIFYFYFFLKISYHCYNVLTVVDLKPRNDRRYRITHGHSDDARTQGRNQIYGPLMLRDICRSGFVDAIQLPVFHVFVCHQLDASEHKYAQSTGPEAFEERRCAPVFVSLDNHVFGICIFADDQSRFYGLR